MMCCLDLFCESIGEKVNKDKTRLFCSLNVNHNISSDLSNMPGFSLTNNLAGTLVLLFINRKWINVLITSWLKKLISVLVLESKESFSCREDHHSYVLNSVPINHMQFGSIPKAKCNELDKISIDFIWGDRNEEKKNPILWLRTRFVNLKPKEVWACTSVVKWTNLCSSRLEGVW